MVKNGFKSGGVPNELKLSLIAPYVRGSVLRKLQKSMHDEESTWEDFTYILRNDYKLVDHQDRLKIQLRVKQTDSVEKYVSRFTVLVNQIENMPEQDQLLWFKEGLSPKIKFEVLQCRSHREAITAATQFELIMGREKPVRLNYAGKQKHFKRHFGKNQYGNGGSNGSKYTYTRTISSSLRSRLLVTDAIKWGMLRLIVQSK